MAEIASDMAARSASFCSAASASALQFLTDSLRAVSNLADSRTKFFRHKENNKDKNTTTTRTKQIFGPGTLLCGHSLGGLSSPDGHGQALRKGPGPSGRLGLPFRSLSQLTPKGLSPAHGRSLATWPSSSCRRCISSAWEATCSRADEASARADAAAASDFSS
jgi:hypothetical protein